MDHATLVALDVSSAGRIVKVLEQADIEPTLALWMTSPEYEEGRLVISSRSLDQADLFKAYEKVAKVLSKHDVPAEPPILILRLRDDFIVSLRRFLSKAKSVEGMRLGGQTFGDRFVSDAYVYRAA